MARRVFGYRTPMMRWMVPLIFGMFAIAAIGLTAATIAGNGPPMLFTVLWVSAAVWNAYWFLWRIGFSIEVDGTTVTWRAALRRRELTLSDLTGNGSLWMNLDRIKVQEGRSLLVMPGDRSWVTFLDALNEVHPGHPFAPTTMNRLAAKWPLSGMFTGYYDTLM